MKKITVLLSTYNGEKFIEEQVETLLAQQGAQINVLVRDDGSNDSTPSILERFKQKGKIDYYIGPNLGWRKSFLQLLKDSPESDYYAFCDQDDHWLPNKLHKAMEAIEKLPDGENLYLSNTYYWHEGEDLRLMRNDKVRTDKYCGFIWIPGPGCTFLFNKALRDRINNNWPTVRIGHDRWVFLTALMLGHVYYDENSYIWYRQHGNNQLGATLSKRDVMRRRIHAYSSMKGYHFNDIIAKDLLRCYGDIMDEESRDICQTIAYYRENFKYYLKLLLSPAYSNQHFMTTIGFKLRVLLKHI